MDVFRLDTVAQDRAERSPCSLACPLGVDQRRYHHLIRTDRLEDALEEMRLSHPMPAITGRVCPHPCETECTRQQIDSAVNINALEQYLGDRLLVVGPPPTSEASGGRVAVIGSGPAGLAAAYFLALAGHRATVLEKDEHLGGLLRSAVPAFRLPDDVLDTQIEYYRGLGVEFRAGVRVGEESTLEDLRAEGFEVFIAATGASAALGLVVPGAEAEGIVGAMDFLTRVKSGELREVNGNVVVVGGGSVALDAARTAVRLGADHVDVVCLEVLEPGLKDSMLALNEEIEDALAEGCAIHPSKGIGSFTLEDGRVTAVSCVGCLSVRDEDGRFSPEYGDCSMPLELRAATVVLAVGQAADARLVPAAFAVDARGLILCDELTREVAPGFFAAGDAVTGPATVVEALAAGRRAALAAGRYLAAEDLAADLGEQRERTADLPEVKRSARAVDRMTEAERVDREVVPPDRRLPGFDQTVLPLGDREALAEADRCLTCGSVSTIAYLDDCQACRLCQHYCPTKAIAVSEGALLGSLNGWDVSLLQDAGGGAR